MYIRYNETNKYYEYDTSVDQDGSGPWLVLPIDVAYQLTDGIIPLARISGLTNSQVDNAAAIAYSKLNLAGSIVNADINASAAIDWTKVSKTGSSLADLATRSAADLNSGTLPLARISDHKITRVVAQTNGFQGHSAGAAATVLTYTTTPSNFPTNADIIHGSIGGTFAANANAKSVALIFDGTTQVSFSGRADGSSGTWFMEFWIQRATSAVMTGRVFVSYHNSTGVETISRATFSKSALDFTANNYTTLVQIFGAGLNDVTAGVAKMVYEPAA